MLSSTLVTDVVVARSVVAGGCVASVGLDELLFLEFAWLRFLEFAWLRPFTLNGKRGRRRISLGFTN